MRRTSGAVRDPESPLSERRRIGYSHGRSRRRARCDLVTRAGNIRRHSVSRTRKVPGALAEFDSRAQAPRLQRIEGVSVSRPDLGCRTGRRPYDASVTHMPDPGTTPAAHADDPSDVTRAEVARLLEEVDRCDAEAARAAAAAESNRLRLLDAVVSFTQVARPAERAQLTRQLYWTRPDIAAEKLATALGFANSHEMRQVVDTWPTGQMCGHCGSEIRKTSRTGDPTHRVPEYDEPICRQCWQLVQRERDRDYTRRRAATQAVASEPVLGPRRWAYALARIVANFPPATADVPPGYEAEFWRTHELAAATRERLAQDPTANIGVAGASSLLRGAQAVASWHPREAAAIVAEEVGAYTFSDLAEVVEREIDAARERAEARAGFSSHG